MVASETIGQTDSAEVIQLLADLVRIPSVNPNYPDGVSESACAEFVEQYLLSNQIETWRQPVLDNRFNVLARIPGRCSERRVVFEAHLDTVSALGMSVDPYEPRIQDGRLFGRGACDTKGGLAAMMAALVSLKRQAITPACDVILAATVDEEFSYRGVLALCDGLDVPASEGGAQGTPLTAQLAVVAEPTELQLVAASKGVLRWRIETIGKAAHSSKPHLGSNAIVAMAGVIQALEEDAKGLNRLQHPLLGSPTLSIGVIRGGTQVNIVPDRCSIELDRRLLPSETWQDVFDDYQRLMDDLMKSDPGLQVKMHSPMLTDLALDVSQNRYLLDHLSSILESMKLPTQPIGVSFGSDASKLAAIGIPSVILGPGSIDQAHAADEFVSCEHVILATELYRRIMTAQW